MSMESLIPLEDPKNQELLIMPSIDDFDTLSEGDLSSNSDSDVFILKNKLMMREGEHNGVYYSWEELKGCIETGEMAGLYYDHSDSTSNWVGDIRNLRGDDNQKAIFCDLHIVDPVAAKKLKYGAKWGVSPSIDAEKLIRDGKKYALDPKIISCALVLRPAVRETMLNSQIDERRLKKSMEETELKKREIEELALKKREIEELAKKEIMEKADKEKLSQEMKDLQSKVEKYESEDIGRKSTEVLNLGVGFGILVEEDMDELKELSDQGRAFVSKVIGRVSETLGLNKDDLKENFRVGFMKENPKATEADVNTAFEKLKEENLKHQKDKDKYLNPPVGKNKLSNSQDELREDLAEIKAREDEVNTDMLALMQEQH